MEKIRKILWYFYHFKNEFDSILSWFQLFGWSSFSDLFPIYNYLCSRMNFITVKQVPFTLILLKVLSILYHFL